jgi:TolA-binding protein
MADDPTSTTTDPSATPPADQGTTPPAGVEFTPEQQERVNRIVAQRLAREKSTWQSQLEDERRQAEQTAEANAVEQQTQLRNQLTEREQAVAKIERERDLALEFAARDVRGDQLARALKLANTEDAELEPPEVAARVLKDFPELARPAGRTGGDMGGGGPVSVTPAQFDQMTTWERAQFKESAGQVEFDRVQDQWLAEKAQARAKRPSYSSG